MTEATIDINTRFAQMVAQIKSLNQLVSELTNANVTLRANFILVEEAYNQVKKQLDEQQAEVAQPEAVVQEEVAA